MYGSAMEGYELLGFVGILKECLKILSKNGKLMATITTISILLNSLLFFTNIFFTNPAVRNLIAKETLLSFTNNPNSSDISKLFIDIMREIQIIIKVQSIFMLPSLIVSLFSMASFVLASAVACCVIEENSYGIEALGKASELVKGKRLLGFALNFLFTLIMALVGCGFTMIRNDQKWVSTHIVIVFLLIGFNGLAMMLLYMSFTVLYFQCKKIHGEEIELQGSLEYSKIPSNHLIVEDLP
ncbi:uncharacterized protein LOC130796163 [Actinidia eriantha]|uniref:uncharacterized protein LOC130796163 n=1 Tax=Actinidia eriantha TaxID=165200 RepID=UPI002589A4AC|nr:uncharacterized protein LOC130796163 [Actinidia eriantha]